VIEPTGRAGLPDGTGSSRREGLSAVARAGDRVITRRSLLTGTLAATITASRAGEAQQAGKVPRIGFLGPPPGAGQLVQSFQQGLRDLGYIEGQNILIEYRWTDVLSADPRQLDVLAAELVRLQIDVLVASVTPVIAAAKRATTTIPIVMANAADPVASGFVVGLARPGGNVTGVSRLVPEVIGKQLELMAAAVPGVARIGVLANPDNPLHAHTLSQARRGAAALGVELEIEEASGPGQLELALKRLGHKRVGAVLVLADGMFFLNRTRLGQLLVQTRLPSMFGNTEHVEAGGLMSYSASARENYRRAAYFVDRILKGAKPADLPVEQPTKFELVMNLKTAKALGLTVPPVLLGQVDQVIE
jgi:putative ABC transport system substrate-binding protein